MKGMFMDHNIRFGTRGEEAAVEYLKSRGVKILLRNYRCRYGELDIVGRDREYYVIIEVKSRKKREQGHPSEAVNFRKQNRICRTFDHMRMKHHLPEHLPVRFDVIEVDGSLRCTWIRNAFEYIGY